jgi:hypothetical protein
MVERFNGRIKEVVQQTRFESARQLEETMTMYLYVYKSNIPQRNLGHITPIEALNKLRKTKLILICLKNRYAISRGLTSSNFMVIIVSSSPVSASTPGSS